MADIKELQYDVVICGGGTAGRVLAARLSDDPEVKVPMIEAGEDANSDPRVPTPGLFPILFDSERDWQYLSEQNEGLNGCCIAHARDKCIGGSSAINLMSMVYPSKHGLNTWAALGNPRWDWDSMLPYYRKFQIHCTPKEDAARALKLDYLTNEDKKTTGPIKVSPKSVCDPLQQAWNDTWQDLGRQGNPFSGTGLGGVNTPACVDPETGKRSFAGHEYYGRVKDRPNLDVYTNALVERVELASHEDKFKATGVVFSVDSRPHLARARQEVVLCALCMGRLI